MSRKLSSTDSRPKCQAHDEIFFKQLGESKAWDPQAGHTVGGRRPGGARNDSPQGWGKRAAALAPETESPPAAPWTRTRKNTRTQLHLSH